MRVDVEHIKYLTKEREKINKEVLSEIEFFEDGKKVIIPEKITEDFSFIGLNNIDFITSGFYLTGFDELEIK